MLVLVLVRVLGVVGGVGLSGPMTRNVIGIRAATGNVMETFVSVGAFEQSNVELANGLRENVLRHERPYEVHDGWVSIPAAEEEGEENENKVCANDRESYDVTVKLFFLHTSAFDDIPTIIHHVLQTLGLGALDLLIMAFPGLEYDASEEQPVRPENLEGWKAAYKRVEQLHHQGAIRKIGVADFGIKRLQALLPHVAVRPAIDQINVEHCCTVPLPMVAFAHDEKIELLAHNDCTQIMPGRALATLLDEFYPLHEHPVHGEWVAKYTAVSRDRGVVESKGYLVSALVDG